MTSAYCAPGGTGAKYAAAAGEKLAGAAGGGTEKPGPEAPPVNACRAAGVRYSRRYRGGTQRGSGFWPGFGGATPTARSSRCEEAWAASGFGVWLNPSVRFMQGVETTVTLVVAGEEEGEGEEEAGREGVAVLCRSSRRLPLPAAGEAEAEEEEEAGEEEMEEAGEEVEVVLEAGRPKEGSPSTVRLTAKVPVVGIDSCMGRPCAGVWKAWKSVKICRQCGCWERCGWCGWVGKGRGGAAKRGNRFSQL